MRAKLTPFVLAAAAAVAGIAAPPAMAQPSPAAPASIRLDVRREKLDNGLRVVFAVDHTSPTIAVDVVYDVGSRLEERGRSGFAHLFEHMMFQGSANVPRGEHFKLVSSHGGTLNGSTNEDRTNYFEMMPSSELPLALWLEADRMKSLDISQSNFENQRAVVKEEYRMRVENTPYAPASLRRDELTFQGYWPYEHSAIGTMKDLDGAQLEWVRAFHDAYYAPNNAVVSIAGDFEPTEALAVVKRYFGNATPRADVPKLDEAKLPEQTAPREETVEDAHAKLPALLYGWAIPKARETDHYALELLAMLLTDGESSRLNRELVRERALAAEVDADTDRHRGPDDFQLTVKLSEKATVAQVDKLVTEALAFAARAEPTAAEMAKLRNRLRARFVFGLQSNFARAQKLAEMELYYGDANLLSTELDRYLAITGADIKRVAATYLTKARRSRIEVKPRGENASAPTTPAAKTYAPKKS